MTKGEVCPNEVKIGRNRVVKATRRPETRLIERKTGSWFQNRACSATIGAEFGSYLGNVGQEPIQTLKGQGRVLLPDPAEERGNSENYGVHLQR